MHTRISNFLCLSLALAAALLPLSYVHATSIGTNVSVTGTLTVNGNVTVGNLATEDTLTVTARLASNLNPSANDTYDLGAYGLAFKNIFASSTAYLNYASSTALNITNNLTLTGLTTDSNTGVIYKGNDSFIHNFSHPTGSTAIPFGQNTFVGLNAGNFTMGSTAAVDFQGSHNVGIGYNTFQSNTTGYYNTANGVQSLQVNTTGNSNTASGMGSLSSNTTGANNTASGYHALYNNDTGANNTALGYNAGGHTADGATANALSGTSLYIGANTRSLISGGANENVIGYGTIGIGNNTVVLGNDSILTTMLKGNVGVTTSTPRSLLQVSGASGATTSTIWAGDLWGVRGQFCMGDSDGAGASCFYMNNGVITGFVTTTY